MKRLLYTQKKILSNEQGFVLVLAMLIMVVLVVIGVSSINTSKIDLVISGNERVHKTTFYQADSGVEIGQVVLEENLACPNGFASPPVDDPDDNGTKTIVWLEDGGGNNSIVVYQENFAIDNTGEPSPMFDGNSTAFIIPSNVNSITDLPNTHVTVWGTTSLGTGAAIQMAAGYEGKGKSAAGGGAEMDFEIHSQRQGYRESETIIAIEWKHLIGQEGDCRY